MWRPKQMSIPSREDALPGRNEAMQVHPCHHVHGRPYTGQRPEGLEELIVGMGCFWGAERAFWSLPGVFSTAVGYAGGYTPNPTYQEVCSGRTGHNEVVRIWYRPDEISLDQLLTVFWEKHDPTQGMRQGNDIGTQYRSGIYWAAAGKDATVALAIAEASLLRYQGRLHSSDYPHHITTEIRAGAAFYLAEDEHQQYLSKHPNGYCGLGGCGVSFTTD